MLKYSYIFKRFSHQHSRTSIPLIVSLQYVKNIGFTTCSDCIYFVPSETCNPNHSLCRKLAKKNLITGLIELSYADINRRYDHLCGPDAKYKEVMKSNNAQILIPVDDTIRFPLC
jgi:hypothetical protein